MIRAYAIEQGQLRPSENPETALWVDLLAPSLAEEQGLEAKWGIDLPTRDEMQKIELFSRLYVENGALFMTVPLPAQTDGDLPEIAPVTFVLMPERLISIRYHEPRAFKLFVQRAPACANNAEAVLLGLIETIIDRLADVLERVGREVDKLSRDIFNDSHKKLLNNRETLQEIGRKGDLTSALRDNLTSLERLLGFWAPRMQMGREENIALREDIRSLTDHADSISQKITFLLDATLGLINIEQNGIIKIFSVASVIFLPPTLVASIYGMNFEYMPELTLPYGYPMALGVMVLSAVLPYLYFRYRGWL